MAYPVAHTIITFWGDIGRWFICRLGRPAAVIDAATVEIKPEFVRQLEFASAYYDLSKGRVSVSWRREQAGIKLDVACCDGVAFKIVLPAGYIMENGMIYKEI